MSIVEDGEARHWTSPDYNKMIEIAQNTELRAKFYCLIVGWPMWGKYATQCHMGSSSFFRHGINTQPLAMITNSPYFFITNTTFTFLALMLGIIGKYISRRYLVRAEVDDI